MYSSYDLLSQLSFSSSLFLYFFIVTSFTSDVSHHKLPDGMSRWDVSDGVRKCRKYNRYRREWSDREGVSYRNYSD